MSLENEEIDFLAAQNEILQEKDDEAFIKVANNIMKRRGMEKKLGPGQGQTARKFVEGVARQYGYDLEYLAAATLLFGRHYIDARPQYSKDVERVYNEKYTFGFVGASSVSKSYSMGIILLVDYWLDPDGTQILVGSLSQQHLEGNLFSAMVDCVEKCVIDLGLECSLNSRWIRKKTLEKDEQKKMDYVIRGQLFPKDSTKSVGALRGYKPKPRGKPHPVFGTHTRVRVFIDEASNVSGGVFKDFESPLMSVGRIPDGNGGFTNYDAVKIGFALNPTDADHTSAKYIEPEDGLDSIDIDSDYEWLSKKGFHILRLDGARSENVKARKIVFFGIQSYEAHMKLMRNGGESAEYMCYGRGWYAKRGSFSAVIPLDNIIKQRGQLIFPAGSENIASVDVAFVQDKCIFTLGRWGMASGVVRPGGHRETFMRDNVPTTRPCIQIDQQFEIYVTSDTVKLVKEIMKLCTDFKVKPEWLVIDRTAIGKGAFDLLCNFFGGVLGINWQEAASEMKVLADDVDTAHDKFVNISSEMWFATAAWLEHGFLWLSEDVPSQPLYSELSTRRKLPGRQGRMKVESKPDWSSRAGAGKSSDSADSLVMIPHLCRMRGEWLPSASGKEISGHGQVEEIPISELQDNLDTGDNLSDFEDRVEGEVQVHDFWKEK